MVCSENSFKEQWASILWLKNNNRPWFGRFIMHVWAITATFALLCMIVYLIALECTQ
ncbi:MAG: hypothetical protein NWF07_13720 [Candidatus Bathyarchaeota archaeon]|nr:hypothetical protein [Candidatus Bathyarchaeota archaeon]